MDITDASVQNAIKLVADLGSDTRWALFSYAKTDAKSGPAVIVLIDKGSGSLSELVPKLRGDDIYYGYVRIVMNDATSVSTKFLFVTYAGGSVSPIKRARVSVHKTVFAKSLPALNWEVFSEKLEELDENTIITNFTKTSGYGGWALASKSAREANAAGTLRRKPKNPPISINIDAAVEEEKQLQAKDAARKEEAKKKSGKRLDILKQQKAAGFTKIGLSLAPAPTQQSPASPTSTPVTPTSPGTPSSDRQVSSVSALLAKAEADERARKAEQKRIEERRQESARKANDDSAKAAEDAKKAAAEAEFKRAAAEHAEKKRQEDEARRQAEVAAATKKAEEANAAAAAAAAAAKKAADDAALAAANAAAARKAAEEASERRRQEEARKAAAEEEARREREKKERDDRERKERDERRERRDKKDKERRDAKEKKEKERSKAPQTPSTPAPSTPTIIEETTVPLVPPKSPEIASPPKSPAKVRKIIGIGQGATQGHRPDMEDRHVALSSMPFDPETAFVAVYDGHGGSPAAEYCKTVLHTNVTRDPAYKTDMHKAIVNGFLKTDAEFLDVCRAAELEAGCTANSVFITPSRIVVANAGDCRCILSRAGKVHVLSRDHKPYDATEKKRIELAGYYVEDNRVDGRLAVSRAIGDIDFKQAKGKTAEQQAVTALPEIIDEERDDEDEFLVVACDGLWDVLENEGVQEFVATRFELMNIDQIAQELVDYAVEIGSMDNTTAIIVRFK